MAILGSRFLCRPIVALLALAYFLAALPVIDGIALSGGKKVSFTLDICTPASAMAKSPSSGAALVSRPALRVILVRSGKVAKEPRPLRLQPSSRPQPPIPKP